MECPSYSPPWPLRNGMAMTLYAALRAPKNWERSVAPPKPPYQSKILVGAGDVPLFAQIAIPERPRATIIGTYGITGNLDNQWFLKLLRRKAFAENFAVVLFDWRAHGKTAELSPMLTSDGLQEGDDFIHIAAQAKALGCPAPFWFTGFSLGGQLALWGGQAAQRIGTDLKVNLDPSDIGGTAVICPNLDSNRSLSYLMQAPLGRYLEQAIARELKKLAWQIHHWHPQHLDPEAIERINSIRGFDQELIINRLGFESVEDYYTASSPLEFLPHLRQPTLILYAADDPMFDPSIVSDLESIRNQNPAIALYLTAYGGHVGYISSKACQQQNQDADPWWAWNRVLEWLNIQTAT